MAKSLTVDEAAQRVGVTPGRIRTLCRERRIPGARLLGRTWLLPANFTIVPGTRGPKPTIKRQTEAGGTGEKRRTDVR